MNRFALQSQPAEVSFRSIHTHDVDQLAECLSDWQQRYDQLGTGSFEGAFEECRLNGIHLFRECFNRSVHQTGEPRHGSRTIAIPVKVSGTGWHAGESFDRDSVINLGDGDTLDFRTPGEIEYVACSLQSSALNEFALKVEHYDLEEALAHKPTIRAQPQQAQAVRAMLCTVLERLRTAPKSLMGAEHFQKMLEQCVLASLVEAARPMLDLTRTLPSCNTRRRVIDRARKYISDHMDEPVTVEDLCLHAHASRRTLQYCFQDIFGVTPVKFLRALRLNAVRRELKSADAENTTVADVAARWGFFHLSHFAHHYAQMFGELPSETLAKA